MIFWDNMLHSNSSLMYLYAIPQEWIFGTESEKWAASLKDNQGENDSLKIHPGFERQ